MVEREPERKPVLRESFGPGTAGELAYLGILSGLLCEAYLDNKVRKEMCGKLSDRTVDFDVAGHGDYLPSCSAKHSASIRENISGDLERQGHSTVFGENGWGRERAIGT